MTEEEINKKAEKHCNEVLCNAHEKCNEVIKCRDWRSRRAGFFCGYEQALKDFEKENAELKADNDARKFAMAMSEKVEKQLREENAKQTIQLTKAKELLKNILDFENGAVTELPKFSLTKWVLEAEQFLNNEVEK